MKKIKQFVHKISVKLAHHFENERQQDKDGFFGLGQFVLLLAIAPFIFNLELYSMGSIEKVPSLYEYDFNRFEALPTYLEAGDPPKKPKAPAALSKQQKNFLKACNKKQSIFSFHLGLMCEPLKLLETEYKKKKIAYDKRYKQYEKQQARYIGRLESLKAAEKAYSDFRPELVSKPVAKCEKQHAVTLVDTDIQTQAICSPAIKESSYPSFTGLIGSSSRLTIWQDSDGLSIPAFNYCLNIISLLPATSSLAKWQITSALAAQVAFVWFAVRGHMRSRSFALFILTLSVSVIWSAVLSAANYSLFKAHLPILVFIVAAIIARLVVKGVQENAYLFVGKGLGINLRKAAHALLLWLPLACVALPLMFVTGIAIPKTTVEQLHASGTLLYDYSHDALDNSLQSVAAKTDDAIFAWHLNTENTKRDLYIEGKKILNDDLQRRAEVMFDQVMPRQLEFDTYESGKVIVGPAIDWAVAASQDSTNDAFKRMRTRMRRSVSTVAGSYGEQFKGVVRDNTEKALGIVDQVYQEGLDKILLINREMQATVWWAINYTRAIQMLSLLLFLFVCLKSYLYVFARVSFNRNSGVYVSLGDTAQDFIGHTAAITASGSQYEIDAAVEDTYYISRRFQCQGKAPNYAIPQAFRASFSRVLRGNYAMNKVEMRLGDDKVRCSATKGIEFFEWELKENEVVLFDFKYFVGMSESIEISTLISTRASSLLLGSMIHSQARGPGKLIFMAEGRAEVSDARFNAGSLPPERIIATHKDTRFHVDSELDLINIYLSGAYVSPAGGGQAIVDVDSQRGNRTGLGSFIKRFLLPI